MSKMDALRAMREARYAERAARAPAPEPAADKQPPTAPVAADALPCGHRNMGGRTCTREQGHAAKSHRYS